MSSSRGSERGLRLLSIDGGGIRGLSPLVMLKEILYRIKQQDGLSELPRPCDIFDLAGGTSTGGLIVIMLFRLQMSIEEAIETYANIAQHVFSEQKWFFKDGKFKASRLEEAIVATIQKALSVDEASARSVRMLDEDRPRCFVCAMPAGDFSFPSLFRTWAPPANQTFNCTIVEAARATSAAPTFFKSIEFGEPIKQRYVDGGLGCNNPVQHVIDEARYLYPNRPISYVISLGTGAAKVIGMKRPDAFQNLLPTDLITVLKGIATDCDRISEDIAKALFSQSIPYCRLNVDQGLQEVSLGEWEKLGDVQLHTSQYLLKQEVGQKVDQVVQVLKTSAMKPARTPIPTMTLSEVQREFDKLERSIATSAFHDSQARSSSSPCLPGTRLDQIERITRWIETRGQKRPLFLVLGTAGSGKTSLLNTIAQIGKEEGFYAGGFFFSGTGTDRRSNNVARLINTITYQIAETIPELRPYVARIIAAEPSILGRSLESQTRRLLLEPLRELRSHRPDISVGPRILLIDALDECGELEDQHRVIHALANLLSDESFPFCCVLSSRFNPYIERELENALSHHIHDRVTLGKDVDSEGADIKKYLRDSIRHIRRQHPFGTRIPPEWPMESDLETIVNQSGGQFIYAATVVKHIKSQEHSPHERLQSILDMTTNPGTALDILYQKLMSSVPVRNTKAVLEILGVHLVNSNAQFWTPDTLRYLHAEFFINHFRILDADMVLAPLASLLKCEDGFIEVFHYTFAEFLLDSTRSGQYFVHPKKWQKWIVSQLVPFFYDRESILAKDVGHLIKATTLGDLELHQAINDGFALVADNPNAQPISSRGAFNLWPFATFTFFLQLNYWTFIKNMPNIFSQQGKGFVPLPILIACASKHKFSNSFILLELWRTCMLLQQTELIREEDWSTSLDFLLISTTYLADYLQDQHRLGKSVLLPEDYLTATLRCLWYLQSTDCDVRFILKEEIKISSQESSISNTLPVIFGIPNFLDDFSSNLTRGAIEVLPTLLPQASPSIDLLMVLKQPFDNEAISRSSSSWHTAKTVIHNYLMNHDPEYSSPSNYIPLDGPTDVGEDEHMPDFELFLHPEVSNS